jgi:K(+)-stimulated pyrophosphate-energized sodium pump
VRKRFIFFLFIFFFMPLSMIFAEGETWQGPDLMWVTWIGSIAALFFALYLIISVLKKDQGNEKMIEISKAVQEGALAYLKQQYKIVGIVFILLFVLLSVISYVFNLLSPFVPFAFITGGFFSGLSGFIGMSVATRANCRTTCAAQKSLNSGLRVAFNSGTVMGMVVVGLGLLDISIWWTLLRYVFMDMFHMIKDISEIPPIMITFGMGASSMALFARLGGGIYTKAADVGADLVGKVETGIPEDDPRNPATIADNVGDNVGDVAGMGADLYESYVGSIVATMALGAVAFKSQALMATVIPVTIATIGLICSIIGTFFVRTKEKASQSALLFALRSGVYSSTIMTAIFSFLFIYFIVGTGFIGIWGAMVVGLFAGAIIGFFTEYYTSDHYKPTRSLSDQATTGPATLIIGGLALGMYSTLIPVVTVVIATLAAYFLSGGFNNFFEGLYGIGISAVGMLSTLGITLATDAYGPVADNAGGIAEMAKLKPEVRERTDALDSLGNTTAATGKGYAIASAALTALALIAEYGNKIIEALEKKVVEVSRAFMQFYSGLVSVVQDVEGKAVIAININLLDPKILIGLFLGAVLPFVFCSMSMRAVGRTASLMVEEVRRQFKAHKGILDGTEKPDYKACVAISTKGAQKEMIIPSLMSIIVPVLVGVIFGPFTVIALLAGSLASGFVLAIMMANSGGAWDNAKKYIEKGNLGGKGSLAHKAAVVGDTVGDPFKDTSGPSLNILLKLMSMVSIVFVTSTIAINNILIGLIIK